MRNPSRRAFLTTALGLVAGSFMVLAPAACSNGEDTTTGKRLSVAIRVGSVERSVPFVNAKGWKVALSKAAVATGALYFYQGAPIFSSVQRRRAPRASHASLRDFVFGRGLAHAHPGHYVAGEARGQMTQNSSADLLAADTEYPSGEGISGVVRSATFSFSSPATGPVAADLASSVVVLEGTATKLDQTRIFRAEVSPADVLHDGQLIVEGCPFAEADMQSNGTISLKVSLKQWLDQVDFDDVPASKDGKPALVDPSSVAFNQLARGVKVGASYTFTFTPGPE